MSTEYDQVVVPTLRWLNSLKGAKAINIHGSIFSERGTPDILCCYRGQCFWFEAKMKGRRASRLQEVRLEQWRLAGAITAVVYSLDDVQRIVKEWENDQAI